MKPIFLYIASYFLLITTNAKTNFTDFEKSVLTGVVLDATTKQPLQGATILIHDIKVGAISKKDGTYKSSTFQSGNYLVEVSYQGYASIIEHIEIIGITTKNFTLIETVVEQESVTITGTTTATKIKNSPQPVTIISKTDLLKTTSTNIIDALSKSVSGLSILSTGPAISKPVIRGLGYNRMVTINDGIRQEGQQWGDEHGIEIDEASIQKAEVLKGPASLMYGSDAMAGVLNLITNQAIQQGLVKSNITTSYLDNNKMYNLNANIAGHLENGFNWNVYGSIKSAADYKNEFDGQVLNSRFKEQNFGGYIGINKNWGYTHLLFSNFNQKVGLVKGSRDFLTGAFTLFSETPDERIATNEELNRRDFFTPYQQINHLKIGVDNNINLKKGRITFNLAYQQNKRKEFGDHKNISTPNLYFDLQTINYNLQYHFNRYKGWSTSIGVNGMFQENKNKADELIIPEYSQLDFGGFIVTKKSFENLTITGGIRSDFRNLKTEEVIESGTIRFNEISKTFTNFTSSFGVSYNVSKAVTFKLNIAKGFRAPSVTELSSNGAHEGTNRYEYGNNQLKSETSFQVDAGLELQSEHLGFSLNVFSNTINNYIFYNKLSSVFGGDSIVNNGGDLLSAFQFNQSNAILTGFETNIDFHPHPLDWLHFQNSFSFVFGKFRTNYFGSNYIPFMPQPRLLSELKADFKKVGKSFKNVYLKFELDNYFSQIYIFSANNTETETPTYSIFNVGFGGDFLIKKQHAFSVFVGLNNLADVSYQNHLSRLKYTDTNNATGRMGVFNMGRNISIKINVPLSFNLK